MSKVNKLFSNNLVLFVPTILEVKRIFNITNISFYKLFSYTEFKSIPIIITGITKTNVTLTTTYFLSRFKPKKIILTGIAGAYLNSGLIIGDIVSIDKDYLIDEGCLFNNKLLTLEEKGMSIIDNNYAPFSIIKNLPVVSSNTVSLIPSYQYLSDIYQLKSGAKVENMEGASFGAVAKKFGITAYQVRSISNYCGDPDIQNWNIKKASHNLKKAIDKIINDYS